MKLKAGNIIEKMNEWLPKQYIDTWDNTGFQIGNPDREVERILIALDLDRNVLNKAIDGNFQMVITHHPIIFKSLTSITTIDHNTSIIFDAIKSDIVVYNAHSNLDLADDGVNDSLANALGVKDTIPLSLINREDIPQTLGYGRVGYVDKIEFNDYLESIKMNLSTGHLVVYGNSKKYVEKVALCGGSGSDFILDAHKHSADIYVTGDIKYHEAQYGHELDLTIIDAGHFHTEKIVLPIIKRYLEREFDKHIEIEVLMESSLPQFIF